MKTEKKSKKRNKDRRSGFALTMTFSLIVLIILIIALGMAWAAAVLLNELGFGTPDVAEGGSNTSLVLLAGGISIVIGYGVAVLAARYPLSPVSKLIDGLNRLASGKYDTRIQFKGMLRGMAAFSDVSDSFNSLAKELENTEMLRGDFVNNFSHEFKTPIVSIAGFAKLLKNGDLTEEQRREYVDIIAEESMRLSYMATNVMNLTKAENQTILTEVSRFNLSEQIRSSVLLLENKWSKKNISFDMDFDEFYIEGNEELLKQVFINLVDNAVKFSPNDQTVRINMFRIGDKVKVSVTNGGESIPKEKMDKIFNKFYQCDESHAKEGNGVGLAIVRHITRLHKGSVTAVSEDGKNTFTVILPIKA